MSRRRRPLLLAALTAAALLLAGCAGSRPQLVAAPIAAEQDCGTVTIARHPWVGYDANLAVIAHLARTELGCTVKIVDEKETDSWKHIADGSVDAILENWGHDDLKKLYIDQKKVAVQGGLTGNTGVIGWYVPPWMAQTYPDITDWRTLKNRWSLFRTPTSGGKGQFLAGDPTYVTNDESLVANLDLNFSVEYTGSEDKLIEAFRTAEATKKPLIGYFYSPQWFLSEVALVHVPLPPYTPGCDADPKTVKCDYQPYDLDTILNKKFAYSGSPAAALIQNFSWTNDDQNQVARDLHAGQSPEAAAKKWLDANPSTWKAWLPAKG